ncbi:MULTISPECIES: DUF6889 family protein [Photorhabdus]
MNDALDVKSENEAVIERWRSEQ